VPAAAGVAAAVEEAVVGTQEAQEEEAREEGTVWSGGGGGGGGPVTAMRTDTVAAGAEAMVNATRAGGGAGVGGQGCEDVQGLQWVCGQGLRFYDDVEDDAAAVYKIARRIERKLPYFLANVMVSQHPPRDPEGLSVFVAYSLGAVLDFPGPLHRRFLSLRSTLQRLEEEEELMSRLSCPLIQAGTLILSSNPVPDFAFGGSVVLIYRHDLHGTEGIIINQEIGQLEELLYPNGSAYLARPPPRGKPCLRFGGPVNLGSGVRHTQVLARTVNVSEVLHPKELGQEGINGPNITHLIDDTGVLKVASDVSGEVLLFRPRFGHYTIGANGSHLAGGGHEQVSVEIENWSSGDEDEEEEEEEGGEEEEEEEEEEEQSEEEMVHNEEALGGSEQGMDARGQVRRLGENTDTGRGAAEQGEGREWGAGGAGRVWSVGGEGREREEMSDEVDMSARRRPVQVRRGELGGAAGGEDAGVRGGEQRRSAVEISHSFSTVSSEGMSEEEGVGEGGSEEEGVREGGVDRRGSAGEGGGVEQEGGRGDAQGNCYPQDMRPAMGESPPRLDPSTPCQGVEGWQGVEGGGVGVGSGDGAGGGGERELLVHGFAAWCPHQVLKWRRLEGGGGGGERESRGRDVYAHAMMACMHVFSVCLCACVLVCV
jgi:hypothetical protein